MINTNEIKKNFATFNLCDDRDHFAVFIMLKNICHVHDEQQKEIEKLKSALSFYANDKNWKFNPADTGFGNAINEDGGDIAREELK